MLVDVNKVKIFVTVPLENVEEVRHIGIRNKLEFVEEEKLEVICDIDKVKTVVSALRKAHPYEEPAIDIVPLIDEALFSNGSKQLEKK